MTVQIVRGPLVEAPTPAHRTGGLLDVAEVYDSMSWLDPNDMFVSWNCLDGNQVEVCGTDATPQKTFGAPVVVDGTKFGVYLGGICKPLPANMESEIARVFDLRESRLVEKAFEVAVLAAGTTVTGTPVSVAHALAMMENALGDQYAGVGTIHVSPLGATLLLGDNMLVEQGGLFYTKLGTKVVVGTGYTSTALYGTGDVQIYRGELVNVQQPNTATNEMGALAERPYIVAGDCVSLKITGIPAPQSNQATPTTPLDLVTGTATVDGPGGSWTPPTVGTLRMVTVVVTSGSVEVDGTEVTAPNSITFDADTAEELAPPTVTAGSPGDRAVVAWVIAL